MTKSDWTQVNRILWNEGREVIDEIVLHNVNVHIEQMDDNCWWIGIDLPDGTYWAGNFHTKKKMTFTEQESDVVWDRDEEHGPITPENQVGVETEQAPSPTEKENTTYGH